MSCYPFVALFVISGSVPNAIYRFVQCWLRRCLQHCLQHSVWSAVFWFVFMLVLSHSLVMAQDEVPQEQDDPRAPAEAYVSGGMKAFRERDFKSAEEIFSRGIEKFPTYMTLYYNRAAARYALGKISAASDDMYASATVCARCLRDMMKLGEKIEMRDLNVATLHGFGYYWLAEYERAERLFSRALALGSPFSSVMMYRGLAQLRRGKVEEFCRDCSGAATLGDSLVLAMFKDSVNKYCSPKIVEPDGRFSLNHPTDSAALATGFLAFFWNTDFPQHRQLLPRNERDSATITINNAISELGYDSAFVEIDKNGSLWKRTSSPIQYTLWQGVTVGTFSLQTSIHAELSHYTMRVGVRSKRENRVIAVRDSLVCGDVYVIGSNEPIIGGVVPSFEKREFLRTYASGVLGRGWLMADETNHVYHYMSRPGVLHNRVGGLAGALGRALIERHSMPVCVIQASAQDAAQIENYLPVGKPVGNLGIDNAYHQLRTRLMSANVQNSVRAVVWHQAIPNALKDYQMRFVSFYEGWRSLMPGFKKGYVVQTRFATCGETRTEVELAEAQRTLPRLFKNLELVSASAPLGNYDGCRFDSAGYAMLGEQIAALISRDIYGSTDTLNVASPAVSKAYFSNAAKTEITVEFAPASLTLIVASSSSATSSVAGASAERPASAKTKQKPAPKFALHDMFALAVEQQGKVVDVPGVFSSARVEGNTVILQLKPVKKSIAIQGISYVAGLKGPWIVSERNVGALSFYRFPVSSMSPSARE